MKRVLGEKAKKISDFLWLSDGRYRIKMGKARCAWMERGIFACFAGNGAELGRKYGKIGGLVCGAVGTREKDGIPGAARRCGDCG